MAAEGLEIGDCKIRENREGYVGDLAKVSTILIDFSLTVKTATFIFMCGRGSAISSAKEGKSGFIYYLVKS